MRQACRRLKEHGAPSSVPVAQENQALRRSARIAANKKFQISYVESESSDEEQTVAKSQITTSAIQRHVALTKHKIDWQNWSTLGKDKHSYRLLVKESLAIAEKIPSLNATTRSVPLIVFPEGCANRRIVSRK